MSFGRPVASFDPITSSRSATGTDSFMRFDDVRVTNKVLVSMGTAGHERNVELSVRGSEVPHASPSQRGPVLIERTPSGTSTVLIRACKSCNAADSLLRLAASEAGVRSMSLVRGWVHLRDVRPTLRSRRI